MDDFILEAKNISKNFPGVKALKSVNLKIRKARVHSLMGENGAGKSTMMKILLGIYAPDGGELYFEGKKVAFDTIHDALNIGISMIHQELNPVPYMSVAENIYLGREPLTQMNRVNFKKMYADAQRLLTDLNIELNVHSKMADLSIAQSQMVEIAKAVSTDAKVIIMDEPTSAITENEVKILFKIIQKLKKEGKSIVFITHKLDEVYKVTDDLTVFRDGSFVGEGETKKINREELIHMMVGREVSSLFPKEHVSLGKVVLSVKNLSRSGVFENVSFDLQKGEILGFAGLIGSGRSEVLECVFGVTKKSSGTVKLYDKEVEVKSPKNAITRGMAFLTEDRKLTGLYLSLSVLNNIIMADLPRHLMFGGILRKREIREIGKQQKKLLDIKTPHLDQLVVNLSGGNQQKTLIARWLLTDPEILILDEPTRGIDVGAKSEIHKIMSGLVKRGKSIVMISSELPEILGMSDRIVVMHEGKKSGELLRSDATQEKILHLATGASIESFDETKYK